MITGFPAPLFPPGFGASGRTHDGDVAEKRRTVKGSWHYQATSHRAFELVIAAIVSAALHGAAFLLIGPTKERAYSRPMEETPVITLTMSNLKELEDPEPTPVEGDAPIDPASFVPTQADLPQIVNPSDFVQKIDFSSLVERPDLSSAKVLAVPENINRGASLRQSIGAIFNLTDLDRAPEPLVRPPPLFPAQFRGEIIEVTVRVQFIVDSTGQVVSARVIESTHTGFNTAATQGVERWRFRPGIKNGRRVNTRMEVPIIFSTHDE